jgi:hypothetical protein
LILNPSRAALALAVASALAHLTWVALVALGWAGAVLHWMLSAHFLALAVRIEPFDLELAAAAVARATVLGFCVGWLFAVVWNRLLCDRPERPPARRALTPMEVG